MFNVVYRSPTICLRLQDTDSDVNINHELLRSKIFMPQVPEVCSALCSNFEVFCAISDSIYMYGDKDSIVKAVRLKLN